MNVLVVDDEKDMETVMGKGVAFMENNHEWHGTAPNADQYKKAFAELPETLGDY